MPINFDPNKYKQIDQQMLGPNAFNFNNNTAMLLSHAESLRKQLEGIISDRQRQLTRPKKTYQDAVNYISQNKDQFLNPANWNGKSGAYQVANEIRNNPAKQAELKAQGYNVNDFINALYAGLSGNQYRSEREYKQNVNQMNKVNAQKIKDYQKQHNGMTPDAMFALQKQTQKNNKPKGPSFLSQLGNWYGQAWKSLEQSLNPFDNVSTAQAFLNKDKALKGNEVNRFVNRVFDSTALNTISNAEQKAGLNPDWAQNRKFGKGGATDFISSGIGYLVPGTGALKGAKLLKAGVGAEKGLKALGAGSKLANLGRIGAEGAASGALFGGAQQGLGEAINPNGANLKQRLTNIGLDTAIGAVGDPLFHVGGSVLGKFFGKNKVAKSELDSALANPNTPNEVKQEILALPQPKIAGLLNEGQKQLPPPMRLNEPLMINSGSKVENTTPIYRRGRKDGNWWSENANYVKSGFSGSRPFQESRLPNDSKILDLTKDMTPLESLMTKDELNTFNNDFNQNTRRELYKKVLDRNGYDGFKYLDQGEDGKAHTTYFLANPSKLDSKLNKKVPLQYVGKVSIPNLKAQKVPQEIPPLKFSRKMAVNKPDLVNPLRTKLNPNQEVAATKQFENISPSGGKLHKLTKTEQSQMKNIDTFAQNNNVSAIPDTSGHIMSKSDVKPTTGGLVDKAQVKLLDNLKPLDWFDKTVEKVTGQKLRPSESSYTLALNSRGTDMIARQALTKGMVDSQGNVIGKSLKDVTSQLSAKKLKAFEDYLVNKHAITRMSRGEKVFPDKMKMSPQKSEIKVKDYEKRFPEFKALAQDLYAYNRQLGKTWLVNMDILPKDVWESYLKANPNYVSNNRIFQPLERHMGQNAKRGFANQSDPTHKGVGSQRPIVSPIESTIEHTAQYIKTGKRNEVMKAFIQNIQKNPEAFKGWAEIVDTQPISMKDTLQKEGLDGVLEEINKGFDQKPDLTHGNIVTGLINGQKIHVRINDPLLLDALTNLTPKQQHVVIRFFGQATRIMKNLTTGINPVFSLTRNVFRDIPQSYANSKSVDNPIKFSKDLVSAFLDVLGNREAYQSFKNMGGGHSSPISTDVNLLAQSKRSIMPPKNGLIATPRRIGGKLLGGLENLNNAVESAPRLAEFKRLNNGTYDSKIKALFESNDITTNFNKYGDVTKLVDSFVPYLNAAVQGLDKLARQFKESPIKTGVKASAAITLPTIVLYAINHDNPNYQQLSNYIKDQNFLIPTSNGTFIKIPKPRELGVMFGSDVERTLRAWADSDPKAFDGFAQYVKEMFWPPTRPITAPLSDVRANKNFMNTPIVPGDLTELSPQLQYDSQTSEVSKKLGALFNKSPKNIDYLIKSYGGVIGQLGIPATTKNTTIGETLKKQVTADPVFSNDILSRFYDMKNKLDTARNDLAKQGVRTKDLNEPLRKVFDARGRSISKIRASMKKVQSDNSLTRSQREEMVRQLQIQMNDIANKTNQLVR